MKRKFTVSFKLETYEEWASTEDLERELLDTMKSVVAPTFNFTVTPLTFTVKKARN